MPDLKLDKPGFRRLASLLEIHPNLTQAAEAVGITYQSLLNYIKLSRQNDSRLLLDFPEGAAERQWWEIVVACRRASLLLLESRVRDWCLNGVKEVLRNPQTGQILYERNEDATEEDINLGLADEWKRDEAGNKIPCVKYNAPPAHLLIKVLSSAVPGYQSPEQGVNLNVAVAGAALPTPRADDASKLEAIKQVVEADKVELTDAESWPTEPQEPEPQASSAPAPSNLLAADITELRRLAKMPAAQRLAAMANTNANAGKPAEAKFDSSDRDPDDGRMLDPRDAHGNLR